MKANGQHAGLLAGISGVLVMLNVGAMTSCDRFDSDVDGNDASARDDATATQNVDSGTQRTDGGDSASCGTELNCERVVFVTRQRFGGAMNGVDGVDQLCNEIASRSTSLPRVQDRDFRAWISTSTATASERLVHGTGPYVRPDGVQIATDWDQLASASHLAPINITEDGRIVGQEAGSGTQVWTATSTAGDALGVTNMCDDWLNDTQGWAGNCDAVDDTWTDRYAYACGVPGARLYCVEQ